MTRDDNSTLPADSTPIPSPRETLVQDARAGLTPAQMVERKLARVLRSAPLPLSCLQTSEKRRALS